MLENCTGTNCSTLKTGLLTMLGLLYVNIALSQFNDTTHYHVSYGATGVINKTDASNSYVFSNILRFSTRHKRINLNSTNSWIYGWQQRRRTNNDYTALLDFNVFGKKQQRFYYWGLATYDKSYSLKINHRMQTGLGLAYSFMDTDTTFLNISNGILYEAANLQINDSTKNVYQTVRNSLRLRYRFVIHRIITLDGTHFWQPSLRDKSDYILKSNLSVQVKLRKWLNISTTAAYNKVNRTRRENLLVTFGLNAEKYF
jgi:hypothetical protein